jgi:methionine synthase II (cobalamin-independent)
MFATLIGELPAVDGTPDDPAEIAVELAAIGLEPASDGRGARTVDDADVVAAWRSAAAGATVAVKQALLGPWTTSQRSGADPVDVAERLGAVVVALADGGCLLVEIEEPDAVDIAAAADEKVRADFAVALRRLTDVAAGRVHLSLALTGGNVDGLGAGLLFDLPFASYAFDLIAGPDNWRLIAEAPGDRGIVCCALDPSAAADDRPEPLVWAAHYAASTRGRGLERVGLANASSLAALTRDRATRKLAAVVEAARLASLEDPKELAARLDPRAVDSRSAALGRYDPRSRR